jgi:hypothetical protein
MSLGVKGLGKDKKLRVGRIFFEKLRKSVGMLGKLLERSGFLHL